MEFDGKKDIVKTIQTALGLTSDGIDGPKTWSAIQQKLVIPTTEITNPQEDNVDDLISQKAFDLIIEYEVGGGSSYYNRALKTPTYPGGESGVTIGIGYDLGYNTLEQFKKDWESVLSPTTFTKLSKCLGKKSNTARAMVQTLKDIQISWDDALKVFKASTLPRFVNETKKAFPGSEKLKPDAFGALVSLVFNRGGSLSGSRRTEMLNIKNAITGEIQTDNVYTYIAKQIRDMKRLWVGQNLDGLLKRREEEASLVDSCA